MERVGGTVRGSDGKVREDTTVGQICPGCGNARESALLRKWTDGYDAIRCSNCSLIFASPLKGDLDIYDLAYESDGQYAPFVCRAMAVKDKGRKVLGWPHKSLLKWIGRKGITVKDTFEVGCGDAHFVYFLNSLGYNATGCDISSSACRRAKEIFGLDIIHGEFDSSAVNDNSLDMIIAFELIEHLERPLDFLKVVSSKLRAGGYLCVSTPNAETQWPFLWRHTKQVMPPYHLTIWSRRSFDIASQSVGLAVDSFIEKPVPFRFEFMECGYSKPRLMFEALTSLLKGQKGVTLLCVMRKPL